MKTLEERIANCEKLFLLALDQLDQPWDVSQLAFWQTKAARLASILTALKGMKPVEPMRVTLLTGAEE